MKRLMMTTAVCMALGTSAFADAHTSGFLDYSMSGSELLASDLIGMRVYAAENGVDANVAMTADGEKEWDDIGEINDIVVTKDGTVAAVILGVGGFLGMGEKDVAVDMSQIAVMREADDADDIFLVIKANKAALEDAPMFQDMEDKAEAMEADAKDIMEKADNRTMLVAPTIEREGYMAADPAALTAEMLTGARVYGSNDEDVGEIHSLLLSDAGKIERAIIDVGGFLGLGEKQVAVTFDELTILREDGGDDINVYIDATQDALEAQPTYQK
ncbi:MAG: PRC-barrel domain-containing protein [Sulfitobacter sp.]